MTYKQLSLALFCAFLFSTASADVFRCKQADGTTTFSFVPCEPTPAEKELSAPTFAELPETETSDPNNPAPEQRVLALEESLDQLRQARDVEISNKLFAVSDPRQQNIVKHQIRASYQKKIDEAINELVDLRYQLKQRNTSAE